MKRALSLFFILSIGIVFAENTIIAEVNNSIITYKSLESSLANSSNIEHKIDVIKKKIDIILQLKKAKELNIEASKNDLRSTLSIIAKKIIFL